MTTSNTEMAAAEITAACVIPLHTNRTDDVAEPPPGTTNTLGDGGGDAPDAA